MAAGLAPSLAAHEIALGGVVMDTVIAWTEPGTPLRRGEAISFPDPVGPRWATRRPSGQGTTAYAAPVEGEWAAALVRVTSAGTDGVLVALVAEVVAREGRCGERLEQLGPRREVPSDVLGE